MLLSRIASLRLYNQKLAGSSLKKPAEVVKWMGAVQAQDFAGAKWAIGQRMQKATDADIDKAMEKGSIIRTHVLRPTWHFVAPEDARWMIELSAKRIKASAASYIRKLELNNTIFNRCNDILAKALSGKQLARPQIVSLLNKAGIVTNEQRLVHILMHAELDMVICSGGRQGKQFSYALLDERTPAAKPFDKEKALAKLAISYFTSHGPATIEDFAWWGGLTLTDARNGLEGVKNKLNSEIIDGKTYWMPGNFSTPKADFQDVYLLPAFDEYTVAYKDRSAALDPNHIQHTSYGLKPSIIINGRIAGTWKPVIKKNTVTIETYPLIKLTKSHLKSIYAESKRYAKFLGKEIA